MRLASALVLVACAAACNALTGVDDVAFGDPTATAASSGGGASGGTGGGPPATTGNGGQGGGPPCAPGETVACYSGPADTQGVGVCVGGTRTCDDHGALGPCVGEVTPGVETCATMVDDDCDGLVNEDGEACGCVPGSMQACYGGPAGTEGVGICTAGIQQCDSEGNGWGPCTGQVTPGVEDCAAAADEDCTGAACGETIWALRTGDGGDQRVDGLAFDPAGNLYVTGRFSGTLTFGNTSLTSNGGDDVYLAKLDPQGAALWAKQFGAAGEQQPRDVAVDAAGNVFVVGGFENQIDFGGATVASKGGDDTFIAKLDPSGAHLWSAGHGGADEQIFFGVTVLPSGDVIAVGTLSGVTNFGTGDLASNGGRDVVVVRFDGASGAAVWSKRFGAAGDQFAYEVACNAAGELVLVGPVVNAIDFGGGQLTSLSSGSFVAMLDGGGNHLWSKAFSPTNQLLLRTVAFDAQGSVVAGGELTGTVSFGGGVVSSSGNQVDDAVLVKLDSGGGHLWSSAYGDNADQYVAALAVQGSGDVLAVGHIAGSADFGGGPLSSPSQYAPYVVRLNPQGSHVQSRLFGTGGDDASARALVSDVAVDPASGRVAIAFPVTPPIDMGLGNMPAAGDFDLVLAVLSP